jgi:CubicO group peptidase (beta-lactamase class C family)
MEENVMARINRSRRLLSGARWILILVVLAVLPLSAALSNASRPEDVGFSGERLQRINQMVQRYVDSKAITGAVTIVSRKNKIVHFEAQGLMDLENKTPMRKDAIFRMASMSKPVTGVAIMMLVEDGKVRLTDPVSRFIPGFKDLQVAIAKPAAAGAAAGGGRGRGRGQEDEPQIYTVPAAREVTVRDLLTHTSGVESSGVGNRTAQRAAPRLKTDTLATYVPKLVAGPLDFQPGTVWQYSLLAGMETLSRIVEIASGQTYEEFLKQRLFDPLGMKDTTFWVPNDKLSRVVTLYNQRPNGLERTGTPDWLDTKIASGGGGLYSTAEDYIQFAQMLANGGELNGKRILSPRTIEQMSSNHVGDLFEKNGQGGKGLGFGLSVRVVVDRAAANSALANGSFGWSGAFGTHFWAERKDQLAAVLMIQEPVNAMRGDFENAVIQAIVE